VPNALQAAVEQLAHNSEDSMWVKLGGCHLADGKLKKVCLLAGLLRKYVFAAALPLYTVAARELPPGRRQAEEGAAVAVRAACSGCAAPDAAAAPAVPTVAAWAALDLRLSHVWSTPFPLSAV